MVLIPEVARMNFIFLCGNFEIVSDEANLGKDNLKGYSVNLILCGVLLGGLFEECEQRQHSNNLRVKG